MLDFDEATHTYRVGGVIKPSVTQCLSRLSDFGMVPLNVLKAAQERGTAVHLLTQYHDENDLDGSSIGALWPYVDAWISFLSDHKAVWQGIEVKGYSQRYGYAGAWDRHGHLGTVPYVIDVKTSLMPHRVWGMQTAAYRQLLAELVSPEWATARRGTVQLRADGTYKFLPWDDPRDWPAFHSLLTLSDWISS